jgi:hypothetical protein
MDTKMFFDTISHMDLSFSFLAFIALASSLVSNQSCKVQLKQQMKASAFCSRSRPRNVTILQKLIYQAKLYESIVFGTPDAGNS